MPESDIKDRIGQVGLEVVGEYESSPHPARAIQAEGFNYEMVVGGRVVGDLYDELDLVQRMGALGPISRSLPSPIEKKYWWWLVLDGVLIRSIDCYAVEGDYQGDET